MTSALTVTGLTKSYGDAPAVGPLDLTVAAGERVVLLGHNGSGKTTLLRMAAGLLESTDGNDGRVRPRRRLARRPGRDVATSATSRCSTTTSASGSTSSTSPACTGPTSWESHATDLLELVGLADRADDLPSTFSRGLRQKAAIALAFVRPFELLLVDEPFVGLDREGREALLELFRRAHRDGAALARGDPRADHRQRGRARRRTPRRGRGVRRGPDRRRRRSPRRQMTRSPTGAHPHDTVFDGVPTDADVEALVAK